MEFSCNIPGREAKQSVSLSWHVMSSDRVYILPRQSAVKTFGSYLFILLATFLPAFFSISCQKLGGDESPSLQLEFSTKSTAAADKSPGELDVFIFDDDQRGLLDSYIRCKKEDVIQLSSRSGKKIIAAIHDINMEPSDWMKVDCYLTLKNMLRKIEEDNPDDPVLSGETRTTVSGRTRCNLRLAPLLSKIVLTELSVKLDFGTSRPSQISSVKAYLTNVSSICPILPEAEESCTSFLNHGGLCVQDIAQLKDRGMVFRELGDLVNGSRLQVNHSFYCYPNSCLKEGLGTSFTRLVIEAIHNGHTYYWPIAVNRVLATVQTEGKGIEKAGCYEFRIALNHLGADSPEADIAASSMTVTVCPAPWEVKDRVTEHF